MTCSSLLVCGRAAFHGSPVKWQSMLNDSCCVTCCLITQYVRPLLAPFICFRVHPCCICLVHMQPGSWFRGLLWLWIRNHFVFGFSLLFYLQEETHGTWNKRINAPLLWFMCRKDTCKEQKIRVWGFKGIIHPKNWHSAITHFHPNGKSSEISSRASQRNSVVLNNGISWGLWGLHTVPRCNPDKPWFKKMITTAFY